MKSLVIVATAVALSMPAQAMAAPTWEQLSAQTAARVIDAAPLVTSGVTVRAFSIPIRVSNDATTPKFFANFVASGIATGGVPCFNCVTGAPSALGLPDPFNYVPSSTTMQYNVAWTNLTYKGTCTVFITITSGQHTIDSASFKVTGINGAGGFDIGLNRNRPTYTGPAVLTGKVKCGTVSSSVTAKLIFQ